MLRFELVFGDITSLEIDAIVNAANESLLGGGGVDGAINAAAGPELVAASKQLAPCPAGHACLTPGFELPAKHVIHAVGPIYQDGSQGEREILAQTYRSALAIATEHRFETVAFPCISTGAYQFPKKEACQIAVETSHEWLGSHEAPTKVIFCCFEPDDLELYTVAMIERRIPFKTAR